MLSAVYHTESVTVQQVNIFKHLIVSERQGFFSVYRVFFVYLQFIQTIPSYLVQCNYERFHDIYFIVDGSLSITPNNFRKLKNFLINFISYVQVGDDRNHIGLIQFSEERLTSVEFGFKDKQEKTAILQKISEMSYHRGQRTFTGQALKIVLDSVRFRF